MGFAYLSQGKIQVRDGDGASRVIESKFGMSVRQRMLELEQRNSWKTQGRGAQFMRGGALWGAQIKPQELPINVTGISRGCAKGEMVYSLETSEVSGVFVLREGLSEEQRLLHTADFHVRGVCGSEHLGRIACVFGHRNGTSTIAVMGSKGDEMTEVTQGDTIDTAPQWLPGKENELVYQSAGIGRNQAGVAVGRGPFVIEKLNLDSGDLATIAQDESADLLGPQVAPDGALYYIRRPYSPPDAKMHPLRALWELVLLPVRILFALFQYLNFFTAKYTGNFLTSAGNARQKHADPRQMMIWGNLIEANRKSQSKEGDEPQSLVPQTWQLIRQPNGGAPETIAKGVVSFDLEGDGSIIYTNGSAIYRRSNEGRITRLEKGNLIEQVVAL